MTSVTFDRVAAPAKSTAPVQTAAWTRDWTFATCSLICWALAPCLRRILDWRSGGFHAIDVLSIVPLLSIFPVAYFALRSESVRRVPKALKVFTVLWTLALVHGLTVAALSQNLAGGFYEFLQYEMPAALGFWLAGQAAPGEVAFGRIVRILLVIGAFIAAYGLAQWVSPSPWDVLWVNDGAGGDTQPFGIRVFSTLNSVGPAADFMGLCTIFALPWLRLRNVPVLAIVLALLATLMLTLVREAWIGTAVGIIVYLVASPRRGRAVPFIAIAMFSVIVLAGSLPTLLGDAWDSDAITARFDTLNDVEHDASANARQDEFAESVDSASRLPFGLGLGSFGASARLSTAVDADPLGKNLDGGYIARLLSLGWAGFALYVAVVVGAPCWLFLMAIVKGHRISPDRGAIVALGMAVGFYGMVNDLATDGHFGFTGVLFWIGISLGLRAVADSEGQTA